LTNTLAYFPGEKVTDKKVL